MGLGDGVSKYEYLPEAHTDFAFAIFCQEHGYVGALMVFLLFGLLILFCVRVANRAEDEFGQMLAMGIMLLIMGQAIVNLAMVGGCIRGRWCATAVHQLWWIFLDCYDDGHGNAAEYLRSCTKA
jgi:hypothetical protein